MNETVFFLAAIAGIFYSLQGALLSKYARKFDGFTSSLFRNLSFVITMIPLLFLAGIEGIYSLQNSWYFLLLSGLSGAMGLSLMFTAHKYLPVAIANAVGQISPILMIFWGILFLHESPELLDLFFLGFIFLGLFILNSKGVNFEHLENNPKKGFLLALTGIFFGSITVTLMSLVAKDPQTNSFAIGYFWEASIALFLVVIYFVRKFIFHRHEVLKIKNIPTKKEIFAIALAASPTVIASTLLPMAMSQGITGIVSAVVSAFGALTAIVFGFLLYKEKITLRHIIAIFLIVIGVAGMEIF